MSRLIRDRRFLGLKETLVRERSGCYQRSFPEQRDASLEMSFVSNEIW